MSTENCSTCGRAVRHVNSAGTCADCAQDALMAMHGHLYAEIASRDAELSAWQQWANLRYPNLGPSEMTTNELVLWWSSRPSAGEKGR